MSTTATPGGRQGGLSEGLRLFRQERSDPEPYYRFLADKALARLPFTVAGCRVLDLGAGPGHLSRALRSRDAQVTALEPDSTAVSGAAAVVPALRGDGARLPFPSSCFDAVFCSNVLEHTPDATRVLSEIERVLRPGGWGWVSWTNWLSPWGGHAIAPLHYLGPRLGTRVWNRLFGAPRGRNVPFDGLWPTHIGPTLAFLRSRPALELHEAVPRYYPSQRWVVGVPGLREFVTWNCLVVFEKRADAGPH